MPTRKQLSLLRESEMEFSETRRIDDPLYKSPVIPKQKTYDIELRDKISDILFDSNGHCGGSANVFNYLQKHYTLTRK